MCCLVADDVHHIVDGDTSEQAAIGAYDGGGDQIARLEERRHFVGWGLRIDAHGFGV